MSNFEGYKDKRPFFTQYRNEPDPRCAPDTMGYAVSQEHWLRYQEWLEYQKSKREAKMNATMEGTTMTSDTVEARSLFEITTAYGEDRNDVEVSTEYVVAESSSRAQLQKKPIPTGWDMDYVTVIVNCLGTVRVKAKPREILATK